MGCSKICLGHRNKLADLNYLIGWNRCNGWRYHYYHDPKMKPDVV